MGDPYFGQYEKSNELPVKLVYIRDQFIDSYSSLLIK